MAAEVKTERLARRMSKMLPSPTLKLNALAKTMQQDGVDVVNLTAGETDFPTDPLVNAAANEGLEAGHTRYTQAHGTPALRERVRRWYAERWQLEYDIHQLTVTCGVKQALFNLILSVVDDGDEVIIPAPYWVSYTAMVELAGGKAVIVPTKPGEGFRLHPEHVQAAITDRTRLLILNSPNNPTGSLQSWEDMQAIATHLRGTDILVASDEIYAELTYKPQEFSSFAGLSEDAFKRTVTLNGLSKSHAMTGWRVGFAAGPESVIKAMGILQGQSVSNVTTFVQDAAVAALDLPRSYHEKMLETMRERRDKVLQWLAAEKDIILQQPEGAFYCFPDISAWYGRKRADGTPVNNSADMAEYLLQDALVATVPGIAFGEDRCIRVSFATDTETLQKGIERILSALRKLSP